MDSDVLLWLQDQLNSAKEIFIIISETRIPEGDNQERTIKALTEFTDNFLQSVTYVPYWHYNHLTKTEYNIISIKLRVINPWDKN